MDMCRGNEISDFSWVGTLWLCPKSYRLFWVYAYSNDGNSQLTLKINRNPDLCLKCRHHRTRRITCKNNNTHEQMFPEYMNL